MAQDSLSDRVERLELTVSGLEGLPSQVAELTRRTTSVESQILQLRDEMHGEFSAVRQQISGLAIREEVSELRQQITGLATREEVSELRQQITGLATREEVSRDVGELRQQIAGLATREEMRREVEELRQQVSGLPTRVEMREGFVAITTELGQQIVETGAQSRAMFEEVLMRIDRLKG